MLSGTALVVFAISLQISCANLVYKSEGDINIGILVEDVETQPAPKRTLINSAIWITDRLNNIRHTSSLELGLSIFSIQQEEDYYTSIFKLFQERNNNYLLGFITYNHPPDKIKDFLNVLNLETKTINKITQTLIKASVKLLTTLNLVEDITVVVPNKLVLREFYKLSRVEWMCVKKFVVYEKSVRNYEVEQPLVVFGEGIEISQFLKNANITNEGGIIFVALDGTEIEGPPDGSFVMQPLFSDVLRANERPQKIIPSSILLEVANPLISFTKNISIFLDEACNETSYKLNCVRNKLPRQSDYETLPPEEILNILKIEPLTNEFVYNIYKVENISAGKLENVSEVAALKTVGFQNYVKTFTYNIIDGNLTVFDGFQISDNKTKAGCAKELNRCTLECENFKSFDVTKMFVTHWNKYLRISFRKEPWVFAFISLSLLGVIFCISILIFVIARLCKKQVLEGNPILTMLLLIAASFMFAGVVPFALEGNQSSKYSIYLARSLCVTLPYSLAFSLLLARIIMLATVSKEVGFMSHVAGSVQSFLTIFIFAVQCALSLQLSGNCEDIFHGILLVYLLSYNVILLIMLMLITPIVVKSQRNYKEGKYFTISIMLIACCWSCWLPGYAVLEEDWKDIMLCLGLVSTGSILLGTIFIPRTYLMTVSAARERFTSALPSLATATSAMDIYRASTQPVYDCVNVAAIDNLRSGAPLPPPQPDFYSNPNMTEDDEEFEINQICETPTPDKVTRF